MAISGPWWVSQFPTSNKLTDLEPAFQQKVLRFVHALRTAHAHVQISATRRPRKRAYLMHYSWCIWKHWHGITPANVPEYHPKVPSEGTIDIQWLHRTAAGQPDLPSSRSAAQQMVHLYDMMRLHIPPAFDLRGVHDSHHIQGKALDMTVSWHGGLKIAAPDGKIVEISSEPRDSTNADLIKVGAGYGVIHFLTVQKDPPHWSVDGH